jgi:hypothetical protein
VIPSYCVLISTNVLVVLLKTGLYAGHIAVIAEIIDHNRVGE